MNKILNDVIKLRQGHYCHALEVYSVYELKSILESACEQFTNKYTLCDIIEFFETIELYSLNGQNEDEIFAFDTTEYLKTIVVYQ